MPNDRQPEKLLCGQVKGPPPPPPPGCPRSSFDDVAVRDGHLRRITKPYKDAQNRLLQRDKTWVLMARKQSVKNMQASHIMSWKA